MNQNIFQLNSLNTDSVLSATSTRNFGSIRNGDRTINEVNLKKFLDILKIDIKQVVFAEQVHAANIFNVLNAETRIIKGVDGLVTKKKNIFLGILTADCVPVVFYEYKNKIVGAAHMGYKGALKGVLDNVIDDLKMLGGNVKYMKVGIGPSIGVCCYDVSVDRVNVFKEKFSDIEGIVEGRDGKDFLNLKNIVVGSLLKRGIEKKNIEISDVCTRCEQDKFFSFRGGDEEGRFITLIGLI